MAQGTGQGARAREVFAHELSLIQSREIREFVPDVFEKLGEAHWWSRPCSLSGKYHPLIAQNCGKGGGLLDGVGGLVRHVKYGVHCWGEFSRAALGDGKAHTPREQGLVDVITGALILHDLMKDGDPELAHLPERAGFPGKRLITGCHGVDLANAIWNRVLRQQGTGEQVLICFGIAGHMGVWTTPAEYQPSRLTNGVARFVAFWTALSDYTASRQFDLYLLGVMHAMELVSPDAYQRVLDFQAARKAG